MNERMNESGDLSTFTKPISNRVGNERRSRTILILKSTASAGSPKHHGAEERDNSNYCRTCLQRPN